MHLDHIVPLADGGERLDPDNVRWLCHSCHSARTLADRKAASG
jgi:5-methylcytosine-specific restriction endonuclease McrA